MKPLEPKLDTLPPQQRRLWPELDQVPPRFVLYGGTAIALRLGHRSSIDFDFFSSTPFEVEGLRREIPLLSGGETLQIAPNTLSVSIDRSGPVRLSFFGGLGIGRVETPDSCADNGVWVASLVDLAATKMAVVQQRAEKKDYADIHALLTHGITLERALGAASALYGAQFNPAITLKALAYFADGDLPDLSQETREFLIGAATRVAEIPSLRRQSDAISPS